MMAKPSKRRITLERIDRFHARGLRLLSAAGDQFYSTPGYFFREFWATKAGILLVRFKYTTKSDYDEAYKIHGMTASDLTDADIEAGRASGSPAWVPECVWDAWSLWIEGPFCP